MNIRKWFQLRLSTMIVLTIATALMMALNFQPLDVYNGMLTAYGWPFSMIYSLHLDIYSGMRFDYDIIVLGNSNYLALRYCAANLAILLAILISIAFVLEWFARRKS